MRLVFTIHPGEGFPEYHCDLEIAEPDLSLSSKEFAKRFLEPVAAVLLAAFEEPFPSNSDEIFKMLNSGGPSRGLRFYVANMRERYGRPS